MEAVNDGHVPEPGLIVVDVAAADDLAVRAGNAPGVLTELSLTF